MLFFCYVCYLTSLFSVVFPDNVQSRGRCLKILRDPARRHVPAVLVDSIPVPKGIRACHIGLFCCWSVSCLSWLLAQSFISMVDTYPLNTVYWLSVRSSSFYLLVAKRSIYRCDECVGIEPYAISIKELQQEKKIM